MAAATRSSLKRDALRHHALFRSMRGPEIEDMIAHSTERRVRRGALVFSKGDGGSSMMAVLAGQVKIAATSPDGREITMNMIAPGEVFGELSLLDGKPRSATASATQDTLLMVLERAHFLPLLQRHEGCAERLLVVLCERLRQTSLALEDLALAGLPARLARLLCRLAEEYGRPHPQGGVRIEMRASQRDLANLVAGSRESVNKQLRVWRESGAIAIEGQHIVLRRASELRQTFE